MIAFGPVPSRRLGQSLGVNNIPPKICTYSCVYCQLGRTHTMQVDRQVFFEPAELRHAVQDKVEAALQAREHIDYLTFVPDGEPALDANLGRHIALLKRLGLAVAVITNGSLLGREDVRKEMLGTDWVSLKVDAVQETIWRQVDRPHGHLDLPSILDGARAFSRDYRGELVTETMLVAGVNDGEAHLRALAAFLAALNPSIAYLAVPTRPPAESGVHAPDEATLNRAYQIVSAEVARAEFLIGYEGNAFAFTGNVEDDLLSITAVHPMRQEAVRAYLARAGAEWSIVDRLLAEGQLVEADYGAHTFYVRRLARRG